MLVSSVEDIERGGSGSLEHDLREFDVGRVDKRPEARARYHDATESTTYSLVADPEKRIGLA